MRFSRIVCSPLTLVCTFKGIKLITNLLHQLQNRLIKTFKFGLPCILSWVARPLPLREPSLRIRRRIRARTWYAGGTEDFFQCLLCWLPRNSSALNSCGSLPSNKQYILLKQVSLKFKSYEMWIGTCYFKQLLVFPARMIWIWIKFPNHIYKTRLPHKFAIRYFNIILICLISQNIK